MKSVKSSRNSSAISAKSYASFKLDPNAMIKHSQYLQNYISSKAILKLQEKSDLEVQGLNNLVGEILEREKSVVKENIDNIIKEHEINEQRRREVLYKRWNRNIFNPICERLSHSRSDYNINSIIKQKRETHQNYLDYLNKKKFASLSEYDAAEYYPYMLSARSSVNQPHTQRRVVSANPTSIGDNSRFEEDSCELRCLTGSVLSRKDIEMLRLPAMPLVPQGRQGADCISWMYMPFNQINSNVRIRSRKKMRGDFNHGTAYLAFIDSHEKNSLRGSHAPGTTIEIS